MQYGMLQIWRINARVWWTKPTMLWKDTTVISMTFSPPNTQVFYVSQRSSGVKWIVGFSVVITAGSDERMNLNTKMLHFPWFQAATKSLHNIQSTQRLPQPRNWGGPRGGDYRRIRCIIFVPWLISIQVLLMVVVWFDMLEASLCWRQVYVITFRVKNL